MDGIAWQPGVGVERKDVADATGYGRCRSTEVDKTGVGSAAQQPVQLVKLAALALPADPACFAGIPNTLAVQQQEASAAGCPAVALIQPSYAGDRRFQERCIAVDMLCRGIDPIGEQC